MKRKYISEILEVINCCTEEELTIIRNHIGYENDIIITSDNLYDDNKLKVLKVAFNKYNLEELQEKLNVKNNEY